MINVGFWGKYEWNYRKNLIFTIPDIGNDNSVKKYNDLYRIGQMRGINFTSLDLVDGFNKIDCFLYVDIPRMKSPLVKRAFSTNKPRLLILEECEVVHTDGWQLKNHDLFDKIFTWNDNFVDNKKYFKFNVYFIKREKINMDLSRKEKLCTMIASNKNSSHPLELYSKRREAIRWFENNHPEDFDLHGKDWDAYPFPLNTSLSILNSKKLKSIRKIFGKKYLSWKGEIPIGNKERILEKYKFSICYENARDIPGYILEKIFDCFFAGTVPVYWGANNVTDHIPGNCFIDRRKFNNYEELYRFMKKMDDNEYMRYLNNIEAFLNSEKAHVFSSEYFADTIISEIEKTIKF